MSHLISLQSQLAHVGCFFHLFLNLCLWLRLCLFSAKVVSEKIIALSELLNDSPFLIYMGINALDLLDLSGRMVGWKFL